MANEYLPEDTKKTLLKKKLVEKNKTKAKQKQEFDETLKEIAKKEILDNIEFLAMKSEMQPIGDPEKKERNRLALTHSTWLLTREKIDIENEQQVKNRLVEYYNYCFEKGFELTVTGLALAFGITRKDLLEYANGVKGSKECVRVMSLALTSLEEYNESALVDNRGNPISRMFLMKNNFGYADKTDINIGVKPLTGNKSVDELQKEYELIDELTS